MTVKEGFASCKWQTSHCTVSGLIGPRCSKACAFIISSPCACAGLNSMQPLSFECHHSQQEMSAEGKEEPSSSNGSGINPGRTIFAVTESPGITHPPNPFTVWRDTMQSLTPTVCRAWTCVGCGAWTFEVMIWRKERK